MRADDLNELDILRQENQVLDDLQQLLQPELPLEIERWLGQLALLYGVPFSNIVADARMLPPESIRFFYVDSNWLEALIDGAFSIGVHSNRDIRYHKVMQHVIREATDRAAGKLRARFRAEDVTGATSSALLKDDRIQAGFLLRSAIVAGWPGLEICGYRGHEEVEEDKLKLLRLERLAPDIMLCIFDETPALVVLNEPAEDFHFGLQDNEIVIRNPADGTRLDPEVTIPLTGGLWRNQDRGVLNAKALFEAVDSRLQGLRQSGTIDTPSEGTSSARANFAVQLIDAADKQAFVADEVDR